MLYAILTAILIFQLLIVAWLLFLLKGKPTKAGAPATTTPESVAQFYNETTDKFLAVYGEIIQAFRTNNVEEFLAYTAESMQLKPGMRVVDAGCGVCGPACYFASATPDLKIEAITVSGEQVTKGNEKINERGLVEKIKITQGDYHLLNHLYPAESFDRVYFLESFGHSNDKEKAIRASWDILKPGGKLYIKDLFLRECENEWEQLRVNTIAGQINKAYQYQIGDLHEVISALRKKGFLIEFIRPPRVERDKFEHLTISNDFQNLFNIGKIESWDDYVFPIDFYELLAEKPSFNTQEEMHLYFMNRKSSMQTSD